MICGNTQAEIDNDTQTNAQEQAQYNSLPEQYSYIYNQLTSGKTVYTFSASYDLAEILAGKHQEFSDLVDLDNDFMWEYRQGRLDKSLCLLIENEAYRIASNIVG